MELDEKEILRRQAEGELKDSLSNLVGTRVEDAKPVVEQAVKNVMQNYLQQKVVEEPKVEVTPLWPSMTWKQKILWFWHNKIYKIKARRMRQYHQEFYRDYEGIVPRINPIYESHPKSIINVDLSYKIPTTIDLIPINITMED